MRAQTARPQIRLRARSEAAKIKMVAKAINLWYNTLKTQQEAAKA